MLSQEAFDITLDDTQIHLNQVAGITLTGLNIALGSALSFIYVPAIDRLTVGGVANGADSITVGPIAHDDFILYIDGFLSSMPILDEFLYAQFAAGPRYFRSPATSGAGPLRPAKAGWRRRRSLHCR